MKSRLLILSAFLAIIGLLALPGPPRAQSSTFSTTRNSATHAQPLDTLPMVVTYVSVSAIGAGRLHTCAGTSSGVKCWGQNTYGQLGDDTTTDRHTPVNVTGLNSSVSAIDASYGHTCALASGGVKCWGNNFRGQLGDNTTTQRHTPVDVVGLSSGITAIAVGDNHSCALTSNGGAKCWGQNTYGQLGDNTTTDRHTPVDVSGLTSGVTAIAAGGAHSCARTSGGVVKCWGNNFYGQLGDDTTTQRHTPVFVKGLTNAVIVAAGYDHTCALTIKGGVKCWGANYSGELGDGTTIERHTPVDVVGLSSGITAIAMMEGWHTCTLSTGGGVRCWGYNVYGQLGDGTTISRHTPAPFLDLPVSYSNFSQAAQGNIGGNRGRINSWFDHNLPNYGEDYQILTWQGNPPRSYPPGPSDNPDLYCVLGYSCYAGHNGIDFSQQPRTANEVVFAAATGTVTSTISGCRERDITCGNYYGNQVWIDHRDGYATLYGHLKTISVTNGLNITHTALLPLGVMGNTGNSTGTHLHFGVYYDQNNDGQWTRNEVVDPYGWLGINPDPWSVPSQYLWKYPLQAQQAAGSSGANLTSPSGNVNVTVPSGSLSSTVTLQLWDMPPVVGPSALLRSTGHSFSLLVLEWLAGGESNSKTKAKTAAASFVKPVTVTVTYGITETQHLNVNQLTFYRWNDATGVWVAVPTTVDTYQKQTTAQTIEIGNFDLQAPLLCPADRLEPNDNYYVAKVISTDGTPVSSLFDITQDEDWFRLNAVAGMVYTFRTSNLATGVGTVLQVYGLDGIIPLVSDDNSGGGKASLLIWRAPATGTYFVRIQNMNPNASGCSATYNVSIREVPPIFLPFILR